MKRKLSLGLAIFLLAVLCACDPGALLKKNQDDAGGDQPVPQFGHMGLYGGGAGGLSPGSTDPSEVPQRGFFGKVGAFLGRGWDGLKNRIASMGTHSFHSCAAGVRQSLNMLLGTNVGSGPAACSYNEHYLNNNFKKAGFKWVTVTGADRTFDGGDVVVCERPGGCGQSVENAGHIEMVVPNPSGGLQFASDFRQRASICFTNQRSYVNPRQYRLVPTGVARADGADSALEKYLAGLLLARAEAGETKYAIDDGMKKVKINDHYKAELIGPVGDYELLVYEPPNDNTTEPINYKLFKKTGDKKVLVTTAYENPYVALKSVADKKTQRMLADAYVKNWIKADGKPRVQQAVNQAIVFDPIQKEAYLDNELKLPAEYRIIDSSDRP